MNFSASRLALSTTLASALVLGALASPRVAHAQGQEKALAEALFKEGRELLAQGKTAEACTRFEQSQRVEAKLGTLLNLAACHEQVGRTASAWGEFLEAAEIAHRSQDDKREAFARDHAKALDGKLSKVELTRADDSPDLALAVDGKPLDVHLVGAGLPLDPGKHVIEARAPGKAPWRTEVVLPVGPTRLVVRIPALAAGDGAAAQPTASPGAAPPSSRPEQASPPAQATGLPTAAWVGFGVGASGLVIGAITGGISISDTSTIKVACHNGSCPAPQAPALSDANTLANVSNVAFGVAIAGAAVGVVAIVLAPGNRDKQGAIVVLPSPGGATLHARF